MTSSAFASNVECLAEDALVPRLTKRAVADELEGFSSDADDDDDDDDAHGPDKRGLVPPAAPQAGRRARPASPRPSSCGTAT